MASFNFYLKGVKDTPTSRKSTKETPILLYLRYNRKTCVFYSGKKIAPKNWSFSQKRAKSSYANSASLNATLESFEVEVRDVYNQLTEAGKIPTPKRLKTVFQTVQDKKNESSLIKDLWAEFLDRKEGSHSFNTRKNYKQYLEKYKDFEAWKTAKLKRKTPVEYDAEEITFKLSGEIQSYMEENGYAKNTIGDFIKCLKAVLNYFHQIGRLKNDVYKRFKVLKEESQNIYLTEEELTQLFELDLNEKPSLERVRDLFLIGAWTGLRFSDFTQLKKENFNGEIIKIKTQKTGEVVSIPIHPVVRMILNKYGWELPKVISNQKFNDYIKEVCRLAGIEERVLKAITKGGEKESHFSAKWELVSSHTARRSFATNLYLKGFPSLLLMKITGHKTEKAFLKYIKVEKEEAALKLADFFEREYSGSQQIKLA